MALTLKEFLKIYNFDKNRGDDLIVISESDESVEIYFDELMRSRTKKVNEVKRCEVVRIESGVSCNDDITLAQIKEGQVPIFTAIVVDTSKCSWNDSHDMWLQKKFIGKLC